MASPPTTPLAVQVGGHSGILTMEDGSMLIKPAVPLELQFYQSLRADDAFAPLRPFIPIFYGTLKLEGQLDVSQPADQGISVIAADQHATPGAKDESLSLVLENLSHPFRKPNILDIKLGTVLYDESAPPEKVARMIAAAQRTTSLETGIRLTGFQIYDNATAEPVRVPKAYGRALKPSDLPDGIAQFFPLASSAPTIIPAASSASAHVVGLPRHVLLPILHAIREDIADIRKALSEIHMRMVGCSVLIVYEADWARAEEGVKVLAEDEDDGKEEDDNEDEDDDDDDDDETKRPRPYTVKLIDFAHTRFKPGQGPDESVLLGLDTILKLLEGRIEQVAVEENN